MSIENNIKEFLKNLSLTLSIFDDDLELSYDTDILPVFLNNIKIKLLRGKKLLAEIIESKR